MPETIAGITDYDRLRSHTNHPFMVGLGGYSTARTASLGDPCDRLAERGLLDKVRVTQQSWQAVAVGNIDDDPDLEIWTIDERKTLERLVAD